MPKFRKILHDTPLVNTLIYMEDQLKQLEPTGFKPGVQIHKFSEVLKIGSSSKIGEWFHFALYVLAVLTFVCMRFSQRLPETGRHCYYHVHQRIHRRTERRDFVARELDSHHESVLRFHGNLRWRLLDRIPAPCTRVWIIGRKRLFTLWHRHRLLNRFNHDG